MADQDRSREQLISELEELRRQVAECRSDNQRLESALQASGLRHKALLYNLPEKLFWKDSALAYVSCNHNYAKDFGMTPEQIVGKTDYDLYAPELADKYRADDRRIMDSGATEEIEETYRTPDGKESIVRTVKAALQDEAGNVTGILGIFSDVTARRETEQALRERETRLIEAQEVASLGFYVLDIAQDRWTSSSVLDRIFDIPADYARTLEGWTALVHPDERPSMLDYFTREVVGEGKPFDRQYRIVRHGDRGVRSVHGLGRLQFDAAGKPVSMLGTIQDITARKQAEEALKRAHDELDQRVRLRTAELSEANEQLKQEAEGRLLLEESRRESERCLNFALEVSSTGAWDLNLADHTAQQNLQLDRIFGYEPRPPAWTYEMFLGHVVPQDRDSVDEKFRRAVDSHGDWNFECRIRRRDGELRWVWVAGRHRSDGWGNPPHMTGILQDITDRKRAEEALRQSERRFRNYFEQGLIGMAVTSLDKRWLEVNDRLCEIMGYSREELCQKTWTELTHPDDLEPNFQLFDRLLAGEIEYFTLNKRYLKKDRSIVYTTLHTRAFRAEDGTIDHIVTLIEDITERRRAEDALRRERRTLEHMLKASDHERQLIAYDIHDGLAQELAGAIMQFQVFDHLRETQAEEARKAYQGGVTLLRQGHAEARRLISGVRPPILDEAGVMAAISHLVNERAFEQEPKIEVRSKIRFRRLAPVLENVIYRIVQEGLTNACKHSKSERVRISLMQRGDRLRIAIRDWGIGFDPAIAHENRFGLEGMRERARLLGGKFRIRGKPNEGTQVIVEVPIVERSADE